MYLLTKSRIRAILYCVYQGSLLWFYAGFVQDGCASKFAQKDLNLNMIQNNPLWHTFLHRLGGIKYILIF